MSNLSQVLGPGVQVFERGWLSSNNILLDDGNGATLIDSEHCTHAAQTVALVRQRIGERPLLEVINTHLHSDHCGGNAALQRARLLAMLPRPWRARARCTTIEPRLPRQSITSQAPGRKRVSRSRHPQDR